MKNVFRTDGWFSRIADFLVGCIEVSLLWILCSIPVVTIGASTTALYDTVHRNVRDGKGYAAKTFFGSFCANFKQATIIWLLQLALLLLSAADLFICRSALIEKGIVGVFFVGALVLFLFTAVWMIVSCCYQARFEQTVKATMKNCAVICIGKMNWSFVMLLFLLLTLFLGYLMPFLWIILPGLLFCLYQGIMEHIFQDYLTAEKKGQED